LFFCLFLAHLLTDRSRFFYLGGVLVQLTRAPFRPPANQPASPSAPTLLVAFMAPVPTHPAVILFTDHSLLRVTTGEVRILCTGTHGEPTTGRLFCLAILCHTALEQHGDSVCWPRSHWHWLKRDFARSGWNVPHPVEWRGVSKVLVAPRARALVKGANSAASGQWYDSTCRRDIRVDRREKCVPISGALAIVFVPRVW